MTLKQLDHWHKTRTGYVVFGLVELGLAYLLASLAVNSGSLWQWGLAIILLFGGLNNLIRSLKTHKK